MTYNLGYCLFSFSGRQGDVHTHESRDWINFKRIQVFKDKVSHTLQYYLYEAERHQVEEVIL